MTLHTQPTLPEHPDLPKASPAPAPSLTFGFEEEGQITARVGLWDGGVLGHFDALNETGALAVLHAALQEAQKRGHQRVVGPMNASTWFKYRLVSDFGTHSPFFGEVWHPVPYLEWFHKAGFQEGWHYHSSLAPSEAQDPRFFELQQRFQDLGIHVRGVVPEKLEQDISNIHALSQKAFQDNPFFSPLPEAVFRSLYLPVFQQLPTRFIFLAEHEQQLVGYLLAYPDPLNPTRVIAKTIATQPERRYAGLGRYLTGFLHQEVHRAGIPQVIHALMHDSNSSRSLSRVFQGETMRKYVLLKAEF